MPASQVRSDYRPHADNILALSQSAVSSRCARRSSQGHRPNSPNPGIGVSRVLQAAAAAITVTAKASEPTVSGMLPNPRGRGGGEEGRDRGPGILADRHGGRASATS